MKRKRSPRITGPYGLPDPRDMTLAELNRWLRRGEREFARALAQMRDKEAKP